MTKSILNSMAGVLACFLAAACSSGSGGTANVSVSLANSTPALLFKGERVIHALGTPEDPTAFKVRLKSIYLVEDQEGATEPPYLGNNIGQASTIWAPEACPLGSSDEDCQSIEYFDLNRSSEDVNAELNSSAEGVTPGTYRYVKLALVGEQQGASNSFNNIIWNSSGAGSEQEFASLVTELAVPFSEPLVLEEGDTVTVNLSYDLAGIVTAGLTGAEEMVLGGGTSQPGKYPDCVGGATCIELPPLSVTVTRQ